MSAQRAAQLVEAGMWLQMSGDTDGARRLFEQALKLDSSNARARELLTPPPKKKVQLPDDSPLVQVDWAQALTPFSNPLAPPSIPPAVPPPPPVAALANGVASAPASAGPEGFDWTDALSGLPDPFSTFEPKEVPFREDETSWDAIEDQTAEDEPAEDQPVEPPVKLPAPEPEGLSPGVRPVQFAPNATSAWDSQSNPGVHINALKPGVGDAMDLVAPAERPQQPSEADAARDEVQTLLRGARDLLELDDHSGAMDLIQKAQLLAPNDPEVAALLTRSEETLQSMFESKLGPMTARPRVQLKDDEIIWLNLDHRAGFVLAQIDGTVSFDDLFEVCGMSRLDTARILAQLVDEGVIRT